MGMLSEAERIPIAGVARRRRVELARRAQNIHKRAMTREDDAA